MKGLLAGLLLAFVPVWHGYAAECPIEQLVAQVNEVRGNPARVWIERGSQHLAASPKDCVLYDDKVRAAPGSFFSLELPEQTTFGGTEWTAPAARPDMQLGAVDYLAKWWDIMTGPVAYSTRYAVGRGDKACPRSRPSSQSKLEPLLDVTGPQVLGTDMSDIVAAWKPLRWPGDVGVTVRRSDGAVIAAAHACGASHLILPFPAGSLTRGEHVMLEVRDGPDSAFSYDIGLVDPSELPPAPTQPPEEWMIAAWRLLGAPQNTHLDSLSRLARAPPDSLGAQRIMDAVFNNVKP